MLNEERRDIEKRYFMKRTGLPNCSSLFCDDCAFGTITGCGILPRNYGYGCHLRVKRELNKVVLFIGTADEFNKIPKDPDDTYHTIVDEKETYDDVICGTLTYEQVPILLQVLPRIPRYNTDLIIQLQEIVISILRKNITKQTTAILTRLKRQG